MIHGLIVLLLCQVAGELAVRTLGVGLPGPIVGMVLLFVVLQVRNPGPEAGLARAPQALLRHLSLLYVPVGVGVVAYLPRLSADALPIAGGLVVSWLAGLATTAAVAALVLRLSGDRTAAR